jgi:tetratricopeptide (TPR) repeat protein
MFIKLFNIYFFILLITVQSPVYSKNSNKNRFYYKELSNYFSAQVSYVNQNKREALKFFRLSRSLINKHDPFLKRYVFSLISEGKVKKAINQLEVSSKKKKSNFFEAYMLLTIESLKKNDLKKADKYINSLSKFKKNGTLELIIYETLRDYNFLFKNKKIYPEKSNFGNLSLINSAFQSCYLNHANTANYFTNLLNSNEIDYSRYIFFYTAYLINKNQFFEAKEITDQIDILNTNLLTAQTKKWIDKNDFTKFNDLFSCQKETDILSEFLFLIANLYSSENNYEESNFYLSISNYLNPKFKFNHSLLVENFYKKKDYEKSKKVLNLFNEDDDVYYWYKIKKITNITFEEVGKKQAIIYIDSNFKKIKNPSEKVLFDMANISKSFEEYQLAIDYYNKVLSKIDISSNSYSEILYRRGGSYERLEQYNKSDKDLLNSLKLNSDDAYVLNYLAYSWLERDHKIDKAIEMLEKAYKQKKNDPFIIDSVGWAYYLTGDFFKAEEFLKRAVKLMPDDPIVNDHYGDILWKLGRKIQARYYWNSVLNFEKTEKDMKSNVNIKILKGLKKI